jgi:hypothetical protein
MKNEKLNRRERRKMEAIKKLSKERKGVRRRAEAAAREVGRTERHLNRIENHRLSI